MAKYRKKPVVVEAMRVPPKWDGESMPGDLAALVVWLGKEKGWYHNRDGSITIKTLEGEMTAQIGDWIIRGVKGEFYPIKDEIFRATYEAVDV